MGQIAYESCFYCIMAVNEMRENMIPGKMTHFCRIVCNVPSVMLPQFILLPKSKLEGAWLLPKIVNSSRYLNCVLVLLPRPSHNTRNQAGPSHLLSKWFDP